MAEIFNLECFNEDKLKWRVRCPGGVLTLMSKSVQPAGLASGTENHEWPTYQYWIKFKLRRTTKIKTTFLKTFIWRTIEDKSTFASPVMLI